MDLLRGTLDNLTLRDLKRFTHAFHEFSKIPWGKLEMADTDDIAQLLVQKYETVAKSGQIMVDILRKMNHNQLATELQGKLREVKKEAKTAVQDVARSESFQDEKSALKRKLQGLVKEKFSVVHKDTRDWSLKDAYAELQIVEGFTGGVYTDHEVSAINMRQMSVERASEGNQIQLENMFKTVKKVLTLGIAGVGKTFAVQKFVTDWAEGKNNEDIDFVFVLPFRELNLKKEELYSFVELLLEFYPELHDVHKFLTSADTKALIIFDGWDENRLQLDLRNCISDLEAKSSVATLVGSTLKGKMLPNALLWVTTRPAAAKLIPRECYNLVTEVQGFSDGQKREFFLKNIKSQDKAERIIAYMEKNRSLHIMCHIPVFCHIITTVTDEILGGQSDKEAIKTLTEIYTLYIASQIRRMNEKFFEDKEMSEEEKGEFLLKFAKLSFEHLERGDLIFYDKDLKKCGIDVKSEAMQSGMFTQILNKEISESGEKIYSFVHLSVQEFLAALYAQHDGAKKDNPFPQTRKEKLFWRFSHSRFDLFKFSLRKAMKSPNGHLDLFVRFLLGLAPMLEPKIHPTLNAVLPQLDVPDVSIKKTIEYIKRQVRKDISPERIINLFHCLNELGDNSLIEEINRYLDSADKEKKLTPAQCSALAYLLLMSDKEIKEFDLKKYLRSDEGIRRMLPVIKASPRVWLNQCHLTKVSGELMALVLKGSRTCLRCLDMSDNNLQDGGVELIMEGLQDPLCKLETLRLIGCHLTHNCCEAVASALQSSVTLTELDLSDNDLGDSGVRLISSGLSSPNCKLQKLRLVLCEITHEGCSSLTSALKSNPSSCLKELDLSYNHPEESGVRDLTDRLNDPECQLQIFKFDHGGEYRLGPGPRKYACELTLDVNTLHENLSSEDNRKVERLREKQPYPEHPDRFDYWPLVLCSEGQCGRCYWEAEWSGFGADVSVAYKSIQRKGSGDESQFGYNDKSWTLDCGDGRYVARHNKKDKVISSTTFNSGRVGVFLDWPAGTISFYSVSSVNGIHLHTFHSTFTEPLYPGFGVSPGSEVSLCQVL